MQMFLDGIEVLSFREAAKLADVTTVYLYKIAGDTDSPLTVKTNGRRKYITVESFNRWNDSREVKK